MPVEEQIKQAPSKGRVVRLYIHDENGLCVEECAAIIAFVFDGSDAESVNLCGIRENGNASAFTSVPRLVPGELQPVAWEFPKF